MPIVVAILGVVIIVMGVLLFTLSPAEKTPTVAETPEMNRTETMEAEEEETVEIEPVTRTETTTDDETAVLASNTFTGSGSYLTPARTTHELSVTLTVENDVVTAADVIYDNGSGFSNPNQERFDNAFEVQVIGKALSDISLSRVGGASLTTEAFNQAVEAIKAQQT